MLKLFTVEMPECINERAPQQKLLKLFKLLLVAKRFKQTSV